MVLPLTCTLRKRVNTARIKVSNTVIDEAASGFVGANGIQNVLYRVLGKTPVIFGDGGCCHLLSLFEQSFNPIGTRKRQLLLYCR